MKCFLSIHCSKNPSDSTAEMLFDGLLDLNSRKSFYFSSRIHSFALLTALSASPFQSISPPTPRIA